MEENKNENLNEEVILNDAQNIKEEVNEKRKYLKKSFVKGSRSKISRPAREKPEFDSKTIDIRRVTRVVSGGRRFSLSVAVAAGDRNGRIGFGTGKALDTQAAIEKAFKAARKNMMTLNLEKGNKIPHDVEARYKSASIWLTPNKGKGVIAGSSARIILDLAGVNDVTAKFHSGTKNKMNNAKAAIKALSFFTKK